MKYNEFTDTAQFYDLDNRVKTRDEIRFYKEFIKDCKGEALEIGCGTGRLTIPLAQSGIKITGLDIANSMLEIFKKKIEKLNPSTRNNLSVFKACMSDFKFEKKFNCIFIPFSSFQALTSKTTAFACLTNIFKHLTDNATFIIHVFNSLKTLEKKWKTNNEQEDIVIKDENGDTTFRRTFINKKISTKDQIIFTDWFFYIFNAGQLKKRSVEHFKLKYYYEDELHRLLELAGFTVVNKHGYYDKRKIIDEEASEIIFICKKATT